MTRRHAGEDFDAPTPGARRVAEGRQFREGGADPMTTKKLERNYDERCEELARYFYPNATEELIFELASHLQSVVEFWCSHETVSEQGQCLKCGEAA